MDYEEEMSRNIEKFNSFGFVRFDKLNPNLQPFIETNRSVFFKNTEYLTLILLDRLKEKIALFIEQNNRKDLTSSVTQTNPTNLLSFIDSNVIETLLLNPTLANLHIPTDKIQNRKSSITNLFKDVSDQSFYQQLQIVIFLIVPQTFSMLA